MHMRLVSFLAVVLPTLSYGQSDSVAALADRVMRDEGQLMQTVDSLSRCSAVYEIGAYLNEGDKATADVLLRTAEGARIAALTLLGRHNFMKKREAKPDAAAYVLNVMKTSMTQLAAMVENEQQALFQKEYEACVSLEDLRVELIQKMLDELVER